MITHFCGAQYQYKNKKGRAKGGLLHTNPKSNLDQTQLFGVKILGLSWKKKVIILYMVYRAFVERVDGGDHFYLFHLTKTLEETFIL